MMVEKLKLHRDMNIFWGPGPHLTNAFSSTIQIRAHVKKNMERLAVAASWLLAIFAMQIR